MPWLSSWVNSVHWILLLLFAVVFPVNSQQEQDGDEKKTSLPDSSNNLKGDLACMCDFAFHALLGVGNQGDKFLRNLVSSQRDSLLKLSEAF